MSTELSLSMQCVVLNGNIEKWIEEDKARIIRQAIKDGAKYVEIGNEIFNTFSIVGIFEPSTMEERSRRKNGEWQCEHGAWWEKGDRKCQCAQKTTLDYQKKLSNIMKLKYKDL